MNMSVRVRFSIMMFLEYAVWGAWWPPLATYMEKGLTFSGAQVGWVYTTTAIASMISPFLVGAVADKYLPVERCLGILHLAGAGLLFWASQCQDFSMMFIVALIYTMLYMPTIPLTNTICFRNMENPDKQFIMMPGISHASFQQKNYLMVYHILHAFYTQPAPIYTG